MKRGRKPKASVAALEHIPAVREALSAVGLEMVIRPIGVTHAAGRGDLNDRNTVGQPATRSDASLHSDTAATVVLDTPERREWLEQQNAVAEAVRAERALKNPPKPVSELPAAQRKAVQQGFMQDIQARRTEKMSQFKHDGGTGEEMVVGTEELTSLAEVT